MGKIIQGILGGVSGTVATVVGGIWNGVSYMRGVAKSHKDKKSDEQIAQRTRFGSCVKLAKSVNIDVIKPIWSKMAVNMSGYNLFMKTNESCLGSDGAITDFDNLKFSVGKLPLPQNIVVESDRAVEGAIRITWADNSGKDIATSSDKIRVVTITGDQPEVFIGLTATRSEKLASLQLDAVTGETVHLYVFFQDEAGENYSDSFHAAVVIASAPTP